MRRSVCADQPSKQAHNQQPDHVRHGTPLVAPQHDSPS